MQILACLDLHKSRNISGSWDFEVTVLSDGWMNVVMQQVRKESVRHTTCVSMITLCDSCERES